METKIAVRNFNFYYGSFHALKNINLDIPANKVTAFIGPSGCGKSTLLRTFNRMYELYPEQRAEGEITLDGENLLTSKKDVALIRAKVGMVFQKPTPFPMTIRDNIAYGIKLSIDSGLTGDVVLEAKTTSLAKHYEEDFGAVLLPTFQSSAPRYLIADEAAKRIFFTYLD